MSSNFEPLRTAIISLSAAQVSQFQCPTLSSVNDLLAQVLGSDLYSRRNEAIAARNLLEISHMLHHPLHSWRAVIRDHVMYLHDIGVHVLRDNQLRAAAFLTLRFGELILQLAARSTSCVSLGLD
jgi:hypothetical protein